MARGGRVVMFVGVVVVVVGGIGVAKGYGGCTAVVERISD